MKIFLFILALLFSYNLIAQKRNFLELRPEERKIGVYPTFDDLVYNDPLINDSIHVTKTDSIQSFVPLKKICLNKININDPNNYVKKIPSLDYYYDGNDYYYAIEKNPNKYSKIIYLGRYAILEYYFKYEAYDPNYVVSSIPMSINGGGFIGGAMGGLTSAAIAVAQKKEYEKYHKIRSKIYPGNSKNLMRYSINMNTGNVFEMNEENLKSIFNNDQEIYAEFNKLTETEKFDQYILSDLLIKYSEKHKEEIKLKKRF